MSLRIFHALSWIRTRDPNIQDVKTHAFGLAHWQLQLLNYLDGLKEHTALYDSARTGNYSCLTI
jgi:hypothetical protein